MKASSKQPPIAEFEPPKPFKWNQYLVNGKKENSQTLKLPSSAPLEGNNKNFFEIQKRNIDNLILESAKKK